MENAFANRQVTYYTLLVWGLWLVGMGLVVVNLAWGGRQGLGSLGIVLIALGLQGSLARSFHRMNSRERAAFELGREVGPADLHTVR